MKKKKRGNSQRTNATQKVAMKRNRKAKLGKIVKENAAASEGPQMRSRNAGAKEGEVKCVSSGSGHQNVFAIRRHF